MPSIALMEDLEHRKQLAGELARYADGRQGLGLGTALAGAMAILGWLLVGILSRLLLLRLPVAPTRGEQWAMFSGRMFLGASILLFLVALSWLLMKDRVQARLYRGHGEAGSAMPSWELRLGAALLAVLAFTGFRIGAGAYLALGLPVGSEPSPLGLWGSTLLSTFALMAAIGTVLLLALAWRRVPG